MFGACTGRCEISFGALAVFGIAMASRNFDNSLGGNYTFGKVL